MTRDDKVLLIPKIQDGIVIDHIPAGLGVELLGLLRAHDEIRDVTVALGINLQSQKLGRKDVLKLWQPDLSEHLLQHIALVAPGATIKRIRNFAVDKKYRIDLPRELHNLVRCRNPNCITNSEPAVATRFVCVDEKRRRFRCHFCERVFALERLELILPRSGGEGMAA